MMFPIPKTEVRLASPPQVHHEASSVTNMTPHLILNGYQKRGLQPTVKVRYGYFFLDCGFKPY